VVRLAVTALLSLALLAGCGGGDEPEGVEPKEWAADVCGSLQQWQSTLERKAQALTGEVVAAKDAEDAKRRISAFLTDVLADTDRMLEALDEAGAPAVEDGEAIADDLTVGLRQVQAAFQQARDSVVALPTDDTQDFQDELVVIGRDLQTRGEVIEEQLDEIRTKGGELREAFEQTPACSELSVG
jgi:ElaB/YqjD/DUF883 family membrane-anchored ribosome-binding protein